MLYNPFAVNNYMIDTVYIKINFILDKILLQYRPSAISTALCLITVVKLWPSPFALRLSKAFDSVNHDLFMAYHYCSYTNKTISVYQSSDSRNRLTFFFSSLPKVIFRLPIVSNIHQKLPASSILLGDDLLYGLTIA